MYDIINQIISHIWNSESGFSTTEQQLIYYISGACIIILLVWTLDTISRLIVNIGKRG